VKKYIILLLGVIAALTAWADNNTNRSVAVPTDMYVEPGTNSCVVTWNDEENSAWNLRYRLNEPIEAKHLGWDFENQNINDWTLIDADGDGLGWGINTKPAYVYHGNVSLTSASYLTNPLDPDNWLISPKVVLDGTLSLWVGQRSSTYRDNFAIYLCVGDFTSTDDFVKVSDDHAPGSWTLFTVDLSEYDEQEGYFAIRHYNSYGMWALFLDDVAIDVPEKPHEWIYVNDLTKMEYTIEDLEMATDYEVQVQAIGDDGTLSEWCRPDVFTTLEDEPIIPSVHILGDINNQFWAPDAATKMEYDPETETYTATIFVEEGKTFGFSTEIDDNGDMGGWNYIEPYRFGVDSDTLFLLKDEYMGQSLRLSFENRADIMVLSTGEYEITVSLERNYIIIGKIGEPPHGYDKGDVNHDNRVDISDIADLIDRILIGHSSIVCDICADVDDNNIVDISDIATLIDKVLIGY
jgi:hypothetical protein